MQVLRYPALPSDARDATVFIGDFDGVHAAHRALLREPLGRGRRVLAIHHPTTVRRRRLSRLAAVARGLAAADVETLVVAAPSVDRTDIGTGIASAYPNADIVTVDGLAGTTQTIRDAIADGDISQARQLLGHNPEISGRVSGGDQRGRTIGFPTANVRLGPQVEPGHGVYAVRMTIAGHDAWIDGVANVGVRPTFGGKPVVLEAHLFDFADDIYGRNVRIHLIARLRAEKKFDGIDALKAQIARDCQDARDRLADAGPTDTESRPL